MTTEIKILPSDTRIMVSVSDKGLNGGPDRNVNNIVDARVGISFFLFEGRTLTICELVDPVG